MIQFLIAIGYPLAFIGAVFVCVYTVWAIGFVVCQLYWLGMSYRD